MSGDGDETTISEDEEEDRRTVAEMYKLTWSNDEESEGQEDQAIPRSPSRKEGVRGSTKCSEDMSTSARVSSAKTKGEEEKCPEGGWQDQQTQEILDYARAEGRLPCVVWQADTPTFCEQLLNTERYTLLEEDEQMTAIHLTSLYGQSDGWPAEKGDPIYVVKHLGEKNAQPTLKNPDGHLLIKDWNSTHKEEMTEIKELHAGAACAEGKGSGRKGRKTSGPANKKTKQPKGSKRSKPGRQTARAVKLRIAEKLGDGQKEAACQGQAHSVETPHASHSRREDTDKPSTVVENDTGNAGASTIPDEWSKEEFKLLKPEVQVELIRSHRIVLENRLRAQENDRKLKMMTELWNK